MIGEVGRESQRLHTRDQQLVIQSVTSGASRKSALGLHLGQRLMEGEHHMGGGGVAPFAVAVLEAAPLVVEVEREAERLALGRFECRLIRDDEAEARHALDALVGGGDEEVDAPILDRDVHAAEGAHRVDHEGLAVRLGDPRHCLDVIQKPGGGLRVDHRDMGDRRVLVEDRLDLRRVGDAVVGLGILAVGHARVFADLHLTVAVGAVRAQQHFLAFADHGGDHAFDAEGAGALHKHRRVGFGRALGKLDELAADVLCDGLVVVVPGAVVEEHLFLDRARGGQRSGGEEFIVGGHCGSFLWWVGLSLGFLSLRQPSAATKQSFAVSGHGQSTGLSVSSEGGRIIVRCVCIARRSPGGVGGDRR